MSSHGGKRPGAGRKAAVKKTANLCGIRVTPSQLEGYKRAAWIANMSASAWVVYQLDKAVDSVADLIAVAYEEKPKKRR